MSEPGAREKDLPAQEFRSDWRDEWQFWRMKMLTRLGKTILPDGHWRGSNPEEMPSLYLTYDDGPSPHTTPELLKILEEEKAFATFFMIGSHVEKHPELVKMVLDAGHSIGNHSYSHPWLPSLTPNQTREQIEKTNDLIVQSCAHKPKLFRPPYGVASYKAAKVLKEHDMTPVYWGAVSDDWHWIGADRVVSRTERSLKDGALIVLHENKWIAKQTIEATRRLLEIGKQRGFSFHALQ